MPASIVYWLGGKTRIKKDIQSDFDIIQLGEQGIARESMNVLADHLQVSKKFFAEDILNISVKTIERKGPNARMDRAISSHALEIAKVLDHAMSVFEDEGKIRRWLHKDNRALNNKKPISLLGTLTGLNMVNDLLGRIEHGIYS